MSTDFRPKMETKIYGRLNDFREGKIPSVIAGIDRYAIEHEISRTMKINLINVDIRKKQKLI